MSVDRPTVPSRFVKKLRERMDATAEAGMEALERWDPKAAMEARERTEAALRLTLGKGIKQRAHVQHTPPHRACFLLDLFLAKTDRKVIPGDLVEEFTTSILPKYGRRRARFWFWVQTVRTIATRNPISKLILVGALTRLVEWIFRGIGA